MQTIDFPLPLLIGGIVAGVLGAAATAIFHQSIMPSVNKALPRKQQIPTYATDWNLFFVLRKHKELHPVSKARDTMYVLFVSAGVILVVVFLFAWSEVLVKNWLGTRQ